MPYSVLETASAAVDDEADEPELRRMLDEAYSDDGVRAAWVRYHAVSAAMRGQWCSGTSRLRTRVWNALQADRQPAAGPVPDDPDNCPV